MPNQNCDKSVSGQEPTSEELQAANEQKNHAEPVLAQLDVSLELDPEIELDTRADEDYTPDEPVSKSGMQYTAKARNAEKVNRMGTASLGKLVLEFAIPSIISMVVNGSYQIISSIFLGLSLGELGLATVTVATPLMTLALAMSVLVGAGGNALAAIKLGEGKHETAERVVGNAFVLCVGLALLSTLITFVFMDPILALSASTDLVHDQARLYVSIIAAGFVFQFVGMGFNNFMRTAGNPQGALYVMIVGLGAGTVFNFLFVMVFGWGVAGSALATILGMLFTSIGVLNYFIRSKTNPLRLRRRFITNPSLRLMANICVLGSAAFFLQMAAVVINLVLNNQLVLYGAMDPIGSEGALAAIGVMMRIAMFAFFPILGISVAVQPLIGFNFGAQLYPRVKKTFFIAIAWVVSFGIFFWILVHAFPTQIVELFGVANELHDFTIDAIQVMMLLMPLVGIQVLAAGYFQATGQPLKSMFLSMTRQLLYLIPLLFLLPVVSLEYSWGITQLESLYYAYPIADVLSIITACTMMLFEMKRLNRLQSGKPDAGSGKRGETALQAGS